MSMADGVGIGESPESLLVPMDTTIQQGVSVFNSSIGKVWLQVEAFENVDSIFEHFNRYTSDDVNVPNFLLYFRDGVDDELRELVEARLGEYILIDDNTGYYDTFPGSRVWRQTHYYDTGEVFGTFYVAEKTNPKEEIAA